MPKSFKRALELGCGESSVLANVDIDELFLYDKNSYHHNVVHDVLEKFPHNKVDLILDSHLAHCLKDSQDIRKYLSNVHLALNENGHFILEMMIRNKSFDQFIGNQNVPTRTILTEREVEALLIQSNFKILYFTIAWGKKFILENHLEQPDKNHPDVLQVICIKKGPS